MRRAVVILALCSSLSCAKHPVITVAVASGTIGLMSCEINGASQGACGIIGGTAALVLGGIAALVTAFADTNAHQLPTDEELLPNGAVRVHTHTDLPPVPLDAGVPDAAVMTDAPPPDA